VKTDTIFYRLFQSFPGIFFELIDRPPGEANQYQFASVEVKQLAFRIDGVFLLNADAPDPPIYFGEVQFQPDSKFYSRFFTEIFLYLDKSDRANDWRGVVIFPNRSVDTGETRRYRELLNPQRVSRIYLDELESPASIGLETVELIVASEERAIAKARDLLRRIPQEITGGRSQRELLQLIESILMYKLPRLSREEIEAMFSLSDLKQTRVYQEALEEGRTEGREEGRTEGREEGRTEGRILGKLESIPRLLELGLTVEQIATALDLEVEQVRAVLDDR